MKIIVLKNIVSFFFIYIIHFQKYFVNSFTPILDKKLSPGRLPGKSILR